MVSKHRPVDASATAAGSSSMALKATPTSWRSPDSTGDGYLVTVPSNAESEAPGTQSTK